MIEIKMTGICENCHCADLELDSIEFYSQISADTQWSIRCKHEDACAAMKYKTEKIYEDDLK